MSIAIDLQLNKGNLNAVVLEATKSLNGLGDSATGAVEKLNAIFASKQFKSLNLKAKRESIAPIIKPLYTNPGGAQRAINQAALTGIAPPKIRALSGESIYNAGRPQYTETYGGIGQTVPNTNTAALMAGADKAKAAMVAEKELQSGLKVSREKASADILVAEKALQKELIRAKKSTAVVGMDLSKKTASQIITDVDKTEKEIKESNKKIREHFETGFSMHILQIYAAPAIRAVNRAIKQTLTIFAEFDKVYTDFAVKSEEFGRVMTRTELYTLAVGQAFSATNLAQAGERFAASGIDVTKGSDAMIRSLELATIANIGFDESANVLIKTMQAYHLPMSDASRITDTMVNVANASTAELKDLSEWFGYAANMAYLSGVSIEEFSTILGVLSSTGMKGVGTATRQLFAQFQKESVRKNFRGMFGIASDEDFRDMDKVIKQLRTYVQASGDIKGVSREIAVAIGGRVQAQNALNNLLTAEQSLWDTVGTASLRAGTTAELYTKITDNAWHSLERIKNSLQLIMIQFGEMFAPILKTISWLLEGFVKALIAVPAIIKSTVGVAILGLAGLAGVVVTAALTFTGAISIVTGATQLLENRTKSALATNANAWAIWSSLTNAVWAYNKALFTTTASETRMVITSEQLVAAKASTIPVIYQQTAATSKLSIATMTANASMMRGVHATGMLMAGMIGFGIQASATAKHMFGEARVVNLLTSMWIGYHAAKFGGGLKSLPGALIGIGAFGFAATYGQSQISNAELEYKIGRLGSGTSYTTYNNFENVNVDATGVENANELLTELAALDGTDTAIYSVGDT